MDINKYQGSKAKQIGNLLFDLHRRIEQLETADRLTRTHPVSGNYDFVGTVLRTPGGVPVFVASESGLESPPQRGDLIQGGSNASGPGALPVADAGFLNNSNGLGFQRLFRWRFVGTYTDAVQIGMGFSIEVAGNAWTLEARLQSGIVDNPSIPLITSDVATFSADQNTTFEGPGQGFINQGDWIWRHGQEISIENDFFVDLEVQFSNTGPDVSEFGMSVSGDASFLTPALMRGAEMNPNFNPDDPYFGKLA